MTRGTSNSRCRPGSNRVARWRACVHVCLVSALCLCTVGPISSQAQSAAGFDRAAQPAPEGILVLDQDSLFSDSLYGQRVQQEVAEAGRTLAAENRQIEAELTAEELQLTEDRGTLPRDEFMVMAAEFDQRVEAIRARQDAKGRALTAAADAAQRRFFELVVPILLEIVQERRAAVIMDSRSVLLAADTVDITDAAIAAVDAQIGNGGPSAILAPLIEEAREAQGQENVPMPRPAPELVPPGDDALRPVEQTP